MIPIRSSKKSQTQVQLPSIFEFRTKFRNSVIKGVDSDPIRSTSHAIEFHKNIDISNSITPTLKNSKTLSLKSFFPDISKTMPRITSDSCLNICTNPNKPELGSPKGKSPKASLDSFISYISTEASDKSLQETLSQKKKVLDERRKELRDMSGITKQTAEMARKRRWRNARMRSDDVHYSAKDLKNIVNQCRVLMKRMNCQ
jgi:hypothetical protein